MIPVFIPLITKRNIKSVLSTLVRGEISGNFGLAIKEFEKRFAEYIGCRFASTTSSGTTALHVAVSSLKLKKGSEILLSSSTNIATALAIVHNGHIPIPIDSNLNSWNIDLNKIEDQITKKNNNPYRKVDVNIFIIIDKLVYRKIVLYNPNNQNIGNAIAIDIKAG